MYLFMCLEGSSSFVLQNLEILEGILNVAKSWDTEIESPLSLINGCIGSTGGGSGLGVMLPWSLPLILARYLVQSILTSHLSTRRDSCSFLVEFLLLDFLKKSF